MQRQRTQTSRHPGRTRQRVARRYRTCAEALQAAQELEALAEDEISDLRERGREAEADRRADAWNREIARALGEAEALRAAAADIRGARTRRRPIIPGYARLCRRNPSQAVAIAAVALLAIVALAHLIEALTPELLTVAVLAFAFAGCTHATHRRPSRRRRHGR